MMACQKVGAVLAIVSFASTLANLIAEAGVAESGPGWLSVFIQMGSFGLIAYLIIRGLPALQKEIMTERQAERADFAKALAKEQEEFTRAIEAMTADRRLERADFASSLKQIMDYSRAEAEAIRTAAHREVEALRETFRQEQKEARAAHLEMINAMRTAVHDVRDVASATVNKAAVAAELVKHSRGETS